MEVHMIYEGIVNYVWIAYALNLGLILYLFSQKAGEIKKLLNKFDSREKLLVSLFFISILLTGVIAVQNNHYAVASEAWYDTYAGKEVSQLNFHHLRYYKYGYTYPHTIALLFSLSENVAIISYFSLFCFLVSLALIFLSLYILTGKKAISYVSLGITACMYIVLKYTFVYQGKEIFIFLILSAFLLSLSILYKKYDFRTLVLSILILLFAINLKYEMVNLAYLIPIVLFMSKAKLNNIKKDVVERKHIIILILILFIFSISTVGFLRYAMADKATGGYPGAYVQFGPSTQAFIAYLTDNSLETLNFLAVNVLLIFPISLLGLAIYFRKYRKQIIFILLFGFFCMLHYFIYFPYVIQERYFISFTIMFITLSSIGIGSLFNLKKYKIPSLLFAALILIILAGTINYSVNSLYPITKYEHYRHQNVNINYDVLSRVPKNQSSLIITVHWNTRFLLKTISDNDLHTILSFDHSDGIVVPNISEMFYYDNRRDVSSSYPFMFDVDRPTYFIYDFYCEQTWFEDLPFLCDAILNKRFDSQLVYENEIFRLYKLEDKESI